MIQKIKLTDYIKEYGEHWADTMPENCPPEDVTIANECVFYRLTMNEDRIVTEDWYNYLTLYPQKSFPAKQIILAAGLSLVNSKEEAEKKLKLPKIKRLGSHVMFYSNASKLDKHSRGLLNSGDLEKVRVVFFNVIFDQIDEHKLVNQYK